MLQNLHVPEKRKEDLQDVLELLTENIEKTLKNNLYGIYLHGSLALGDFDTQSDVDFMVVTKKALSTKEVKGLQKMHRQLRKAPYLYAEHLEGSYIEKSMLETVEKSREPVWYLDHGADRLIESNHDNNLVVRWTICEKGMTIVGPEPQSFLRPVDAKKLKKEVCEIMTDWGTKILETPKDWENRFYQSFIPLTYCRVLYTLSEGKVCSKKASVVWARMNVAKKWNELLSQCWRQRLAERNSTGYKPKPEAYAQTLAFLEYALKKMPALMADTKVK